MSDVSLLRWLALGWLLLNGLTFALYAWDKSRARAGGARVPEHTLHTLALAGGWPAALLAQRSLQHKTRKLRFQRWFWATVWLNVAVMAAMAALLP